MKIKSLLLKIHLIIILIPCTTFSQSVILTQNKICFDTIVASKIMNDLIYYDAIMVQKNDSLVLLSENNERQKNVIELQDRKLDNKNTGLWITGGFNLLTTILIALFANEFRNSSSFFLCSSLSNFSFSVKNLSSIYTSCV